jgi:uncharacterized membrane protein
MLNYLFTQTPLRFFGEGLWRDETFSLLLAERSLSDIINLTVRDFNPPLYYFILHFWIGLFGTSEIALRSLSVLFYVVGVFCVYELFKVILKKTHLQSGFYTILFVMNPVVLYYAFEGRMYSMLFCMTMLSTFFLLRKQGVPYLISIILGLYTHYFFIMVFGTQFLYLLFFELKKNQSFLKNDLLIKQIYAGLFFLPWMVFFLSQNNDVGGAFWISKLMNNQIWLIPSYLYSGIDKDFWAPVSWDPILLSYLKTFTLFCLITTGIGMFYYWKNRILPKAGILFFMTFLLSVLGVIVISEFKPLFVPRYLIAASAMLSLTLIMAIIAMPKVLKVAFFGILIFFSIQFNIIQLEYRNRGLMRDLSKEIAPLMKKNDLIYVTSALDIFDAIYYFGKDRVYLYGIPYEDIPIYVGKVIIPPSIVKETLPMYPQKAFIIENSGNKLYRIESNFSTP